MKKVFDPVLPENMKTNSALKAADNSFTYKNQFWKTMASVRSLTTLNWLTNKIEKALKINVDLSKTDLKGDAETVIQSVDFSNNLKEN